MRERMKKKVLIDEIMRFCFKYGIITNTVQVEIIKRNIEEQLHDVAFVENLINTIFVKAKRFRNLGNKKVVRLIIELEKLRLELENQAPKKF